MRYFGLFLLSVFICYSCKEQKNISKDIYVDFQKTDTDTFRLSQIMDSVSFVPLDSTVSLGNISDIKYRNNQFYFSDVQTGSVKVFNASGKFVSEIRHVGHSSTEYISLSDFDVSSKSGEIYIYDEASGTMSVYGQDGNFVRRFRFTDVVRDFALLGDDILLYTPDYNGTSRRGLWLVDSVGNFKKQLVSIDEKFRYGIMCHRYLLCLDDQTVGLMGGEDLDEIYHIGHDDFGVAYRIGYNISIPQELLGEKLVDKDKYKGKTYSKLSYFETPTLVSFASTDFASCVHTFYDKQSKQCYNVTKPEGLIDDVNFSTEPLAVDNGYVLGVIHPDTESTLDKPRMQQLGIQENVVTLVIGRTKCK